MKRSQKAWVSRREKRPYRRGLLKITEAGKYVGRIRRTRFRGPARLYITAVLRGSTIRVKT